MVEFIKATNRRTLIADLIHILLNLAYVVIVTCAIIIFSTPWAAFGLVFISKWRVISVRTRYWWANALSNLPDFLLGLGIVTLMWVSGSIAVQIFLAIIFAVWLIVIKPQHKHRYVIIQSGISQFVAMSALFSVAYMLPVWLVCLIVFVIGFSTARQALGTYDEEARSLLSAIWGFILMEIGFVAWHWTIAYQIVPTLEIPQFAITSSALGFVTHRCYRAWHNDQIISWKEIRWPVLFTGTLLIVLLLFFSGLWDATTL